MIIAFIIVLWVFGALLSWKLDSVLSGSPTYECFISGIIIALLFWPVVAILLLTCKHRTGAIMLDINSPHEWHY